MMIRAQTVRCLATVVAIVTAGMTLPERARAQVTPPTAGARTPEEVSRADGFFQSGLRLYAAKKWSEAETAFLSAWALNATFDVASNLGAAQYQLGKYREAGEHLAFALRQWPLIGGPERRRIAQERLAECRKHVGTLAVKLNVDRADVLVDGKLVGMSPVTTEIFLEPGRHTVEARLDGYSPVNQPVVATQGAAISVALMLVPVPVVAAASPVQSTGATAPASSGPRTGVLIAGGVVGGLGIVLGGVFAGLSNSKASDAAAKREEIVKGGASSACSTPYSPTCQALHDAIGAKSTLSSAAFWSFTGAGVVGAATLIYGLASRGPKNAGTPDVQMMPVVSGRETGLMVSGAW